VYVVDRDSMGRFNSSKNNIWQELDGAVVRGMRSTPAYFNSHVYLSDRDSPLKAFTFSGALLAASPTSQTAATFVYPERCRSCRRMVRPTASCGPRRRLIRCFTRL